MVYRYGVVGKQTKEKVNTHQENIRQYCNITLWGAVNSRSDNNVSSIESFKAVRFFVQKLATVILQN